MTTENKTLADECNCPNGRAEHMPTCASLRATLADVQPGGRVRLGDVLPPLPRTHYNACGDGSEPLYTAKQLRDYARAALSAQPSQPGQGDALHEAVGRIFGCDGSPWRTRDVAAVLRDYAALAARQPVSAEDWSRSMAAKEAGQYVGAGAHGVPDEPAARQPVEFERAIPTRRRESAVELLLQLGFVWNNQRWEDRRQPVGDHLAQDRKMVSQPAASNQLSGNSGELAVDGARQPVGEPVGEGWSGWATQYAGKMPKLYGAREIAELNHYPDEGQRLIFLTEQTAQAVDLGQTFQAHVAEWMGQCFLPSLYSNMTERGDRLLEEVLELLQAHGYDKARIPTLVDYVFGRPVGDPAQEVGGVMVTLAGYCWVAGLDMHADGQAELDRINQPDVMARIRAKQEAKNALHFDTPLPGNAGAAVEEWPREGDLVRYGEGSSALAIRLGPHAGGWHGYQCCGGYTFFTKAHRPSRADMDTWLDCAKYRDERTKVADNRVAHEMYLLDNQAARNG